MDEQKDYGRWVSYLKRNSLFNFKEKKNTRKNNNNINNNEEMQDEHVEIEENEEMSERIEGESEQSILIEENHPPSRFLPNIQNIRHHHNHLDDNSGEMDDFEIIGGSAFEEERETLNKSNDIFSFCRFSFLLSPLSKSKMISVEADLEMRKHELTAIFNNCFSGQRSSLHFVLEVRRDNLILDTLEQIDQKCTEKDFCEMKKELKIVFKGEQGFDAGGVRKGIY